MTHRETVDALLFKNFIAGDLIEVTLINGETILGILSDDVVYYDEGEKGEKLNSRIGILPPPAPKGFIAPFEKIPRPFYCKDIESIRKAN